MDCEVNASDGLDCDLSDPVGLLQVFSLCNWRAGHLGDLARGLGYVLSLMPDIVLSDRVWPSGVYDILEDCDSGY